MKFPNTFNLGSVKSFICFFFCVCFPHVTNDTESHDNDKLAMFYNYTEQNLLRIRSVQFSLFLNSLGPLIDKVHLPNLPNTVASSLRWKEKRRSEDHSVH